MEKKWIVMVTKPHGRSSITEEMVYGDALAKYNRTIEKVPNDHRVRLMKIVSEYKDGLKYPDHGYN